MIGKHILSKKLQSSDSFDFWTKVIFTPFHAFGVCVLFRLLQVLIYASNEINRFESFKVKVKVFNK